MTRRLVVTAMIVVLSLAAQGSNGIAVAQSGRATCASLQALRLPDVRISNATVVPAVEKGPVRAAHCRVNGVIGTEIGFSVLLPDEWNQKFFMGGGGGFVGTVQNSAQGTVNLGYATAGTDTGHRADGLSASWALDNAERQVNFGHLAVHRTAEVAKAIVERYYGRASTRSYFSGCSRGGGQAVMEAIRYPDDFDGIVAGAPALNWAAIAAQFVKDAQAAYPDPASAQPLLPIETLKYVETTVLQACDANDGVTDGVMTDPRQCRFDVASLAACAGDAPGEGCVTSRQRTAIRAIYGETRNQDGVIQAGQPFGGEGDPAGWSTWITGTAQFAAASQRSLRFRFGTEIFKYFAFADPDWDYSRYDFSTWRRDTRAAAALLNATSPDLDRFKARRGKLILWHGWSDPALSALDSIKYYDEVEARDPSVRDYFRMFLMPGVLHCGDGPGPDTVDWTSAIVDWVERDTPPDRVVARKLTGGTVTESRPLCPYPQRAVYGGTGSTDDERNFVCR